MRRLTGGAPAGIPPALPANSRDRPGSGGIAGGISSAAITPAPGRKKPGLSDAGRRRFLLSQLGHGVALELVAPGLHFVQGLLQHVLETTQLAVTILVGLPADLAGLGLGVLPPPWPPGRSASFMISVFCIKCAALSRARSRISSASRLTLEMYILRSRKHFTGIVDLLGHPLPGGIQQRQHLLAVDQHRSRQRHGTGLFHIADGMVEVFQGWGIPVRFMAVAACEPLVCGASVPS